MDYFKVNVPTPVYLFPKAPCPLNYMDYELDLKHDLNYIKYKNYDIALLEWSECHKEYKSTEKRWPR